VLHAGYREWARLLEAGIAGRKPYGDERAGISAFDATAAIPSPASRR
jgi:hypothetical protein